MFRPKFIIYSLIFSVCSLFAQYLPVVPKDQRGKADAERSGTHDANRIRTVFYNFGMVGDYPPDPLKVDLSVFHSVEVPKGSGENYSDGATPFILAKVKQNNGKEAYIMETGFREMQGTSPYSSKTMRFEPRPGYFQADPTINKGRSVAISNDSRTWPNEWIDKKDDPKDSGWKGAWNGYFGKFAQADQESFVVYDDDYYDAWDFNPDSRDATRKGLGLRIEQRGFQWANPQAGNVIFFHYDVVNESTTDYSDIIFGMYMDSGVGGSGRGKDGVAESDDDCAYFDKSMGLNLVYTWDQYGNGMIGPTGYLGYAFLESPGISTDGKDNDDDGITDEKRDGGPGTKIVGQDNIRAYVESHYNMTKFKQFYGALEQRPAFRAGVWWTGDEDMDWVAEFHDVGADGVAGTHDIGEGDGIPTEGEPNFDKTDIDESDQIGLTGFKMNRIKAGQNSKETEVDLIKFYDNGEKWPQRLYKIFTNPDSAFGKTLVKDYNIGFLFAAGPFSLKAGKRERFSFALAFGKDLRELKSTANVVSQIYKSNYQFAAPPPMPTLQAFAGDKRVTLTWDDKAEKAFDPVTNSNDFEGYRVYRSTDPNFLDAQVIYTGTGTGPIGNGRPLAQFDLKNNKYGYSKTSVEGVAYYLGDDTGIKHSYVDTTVKNGQRYYYAVTAYDCGADSIEIYPSENAITVSQTLRGGTILPKNVVVVYPNPPVSGYKTSETNDIIHSSGRGSGKVSMKVLNPDLVPDNHTFELVFTGYKDSVRAKYYSFIDRTTNDTMFTSGNDFEAVGNGISAKGILPLVNMNKDLVIDSANTKMSKSSNTNLKLGVRYATSLPINFKRPNFPENFDVIFSKDYADTSVGAIGMSSKPVKFKVIANTPNGKVKMKFRFYESDNDSTLSTAKDYIEVLTYSPKQPTTPKTTWVLTVDTSKIGNNIIKATAGDTFHVALSLPFTPDDKYTFVTKAQRVDKGQLRIDENNKPYVVPNPYVGAASFEPQRFAVSGRGERKMEFRNLPRFATIRIYTINGELVQTLRHDGALAKGIVSWDLRTKDNLEIAPGLYIYHVESQDLPAYIGKFAIVK